MLNVREQRVHKIKLANDKLFAEHEFCWWLLGQKPGNYGKLKMCLYYVYSSIITAGLAVLCPVHLVTALFTMDSAGDIFRNLTVTFTTMLATCKSFILWWNFKRIHEIEQLMHQLDERVQKPEDVDYYEHSVYPAARNIAKLFYFLCFGTGISSELAVVIGGLLGNWQLLYAAYFPFDPLGSNFNYIIAHTFQIMATAVHLLQNFINDSYGGMCMAVIAGHVRLLGRRVSRIGHDPSKTLSENNDELVKCIKDHKLLLLLRSEVVSILSYALLLQIFAAGLNMCIVIIYMLFFVDDVFHYVYYSIYLLAMPMEIFPCCYYGSELETEFEQLTRTIFECNWVDQNDDFKRNFRIFSEQTIRPVAIEAGGMVRVNLSAFILSCRMAYSLFTVVSQMK